MSHAEGQIIKDGKIVAYYEYEGCADFCFTRLYATRQELRDNWRTKQFAECHCQGSPEDVLVWSSYGDEGWWRGKACLHCMALTDGTSHESEEFEYLGSKGHPLGHWNWPWDGDGKYLPEGTHPEDEPRLKIN